jgi:hypothetical protein
LPITILPADPTAVTWGNAAAAPVGHTLPHLLWLLLFSLSGLTALAVWEWRRHRMC